MVTFVAPKKFCGTLLTATPSLATLVGLSNIALVSPEQPLNELGLMMPTDEGMIIDFKLDAFKNAYSSIVVTPDGMIIDANFDAFQNVP